MPTNQNNISQSLRKCLFNPFKLFEVASYLYCGPKGTESGKAAKAICGISTLLMVASGVLLYEHYVFKGDRVNSKDNNSPLLVGFAITFSFGLLGYIVAPIVGHKFCGTFDTSYNTIINDIEQPVQQELNDNNQLRFYRETAL